MPSTKAALTEHPSGLFARPWRIFVKCLLPGKDLHRRPLSLFLSIPDLKSKIFQAYGQYFNHGKAGREREIKRQEKWFRTRGDVHNLKEFSPNMRKHLFTVKETELWQRLPRAVTEPPSLGKFRRCLDTIQGNLLWVTLLEPGFGSDDPQRSLPTSAILWFCASAT